MGTINVVKTCAQSMGPSITGLLATKGAFWAAFVLAGALKASYDLGMLAVFQGRESREEEGNGGGGLRRERDEEDGGEELGELLANDDDEEDEQEAMKRERVGRNGS